jgi:hypothetical protein
MTAITRWVFTLAASATLALVGGAALTAIPGATPGAAAATAQTNCAADPSSCGYPDATNTGVPAGTTLQTVPTQVSSGPGWSYVSNGSSSYVEVSGNGASLSDLYIPFDLDISASNVTVNDVQVVTSGNYGISLRNTANVTIENSAIGGQNATSGRVDSAIDDIYTDSTGTVVKDNNISDARNGVMLSAGLIQGNYIHSPGYISGDHTNGIYDFGSTTALTINDNTIFNSLDQTDAITLQASSSGQTVANKTIENNFMAGGDYVIYGGSGDDNATSNIVVTNNRFSQQYYSASGYYGPVADFSSTGAGNIWSGNIWDTTGQAIPESAPMTSCAADPSSCGYPDATNTGVPAGTTLQTVPTQVSSGPGWSYVSNGSSSYVEVSGNGASLSDLYIPFDLDISASNVTVNDVQVVTSGNFGISLRNTANVTIENSTIAGQNATSGRVYAAVDDVYGDSTGTVVENNNVSDFANGIVLPAGQIQGNYIYSPGYVSGDQTNGIYDNGSSAALTINDNTIFNSLSQSNAITLDAASSGQTVANKTIEGNFIAGGIYALYGGDGQGNSTSDIVFTNNRFGQQYYSTSGGSGPVADFSPTGTGNTWTGNIWDTTGQTILEP